MSRTDANIMFLIREDGPPIYEQLYSQVRDAIVSGGVAAGDRLPSIRKLQTDLGVSHTTVERAYLQLATEGYVRNVPRSGYRVEKLDTGFPEPAPRKPGRRGARHSHQPESGCVFLPSTLAAGKSSTTSLTPTCRQTHSPSVSGGDW